LHYSAWYRKHKIHFCIIIPLHFYVSIVLWLPWWYLEIFLISLRPTVPFDFIPLMELGKELQLHSSLLRRHKSNIYNWRNNSITKVVEMRGIVYLPNSLDIRCIIHSWQNSSKWDILTRFSQGSFLNQCDVITDLKILGNKTIR
jgi:hypothetical protein